jgi:hypothetical protein
MCLILELNLHRFYLHCFIYVSPIINLPGFFSLYYADPMLPSGETDLIGTPSDVDSDKGQGQVTLDISSPDITSTAT